MTRRGLLLLTMAGLAAACSKGATGEDGCDAARGCGTDCCVGGELCSFQRCLLPGAECVDDGGCAAGQFCDLGAGAMALASGGVCDGVEFPTGRCLARPPLCAAGESPGEPPACLANCESAPAAGWVAPILQGSWGDPANTDENVMMTPAIGQLDDDNCDGVIDERDLPDILFLSFAGSDYQNVSGSASTLRVVEIVDGVALPGWSANLTGTSADLPGRAIAIGNLDGLPGDEIVTCTRDGRVRAYRPDGTELWLSEPLATACQVPSIGDVDQDGVAEVVPGGAILNGITGATEVAAFSPAYSPAAGGEPVLVDVTGDGALDVVTPGRVYAADGILIADTGLTGRSVGVADLDGDGAPEIVSVHYDTHSLSVWRVAPAEPGGFEILRQGVDLTFGLSRSLCPVGSAGNTRGGGPPAIGDLDGDGFPDIAVSAGIGLFALNGRGLVDPLVAEADTLLWAVQVRDCSSAATGVSAFDFDGEGAVEVVFGDEVDLRVFDGGTGTILFTACNTNGTLFENPIVADVDSDGHAEIVAPSNSYSSLACAGGVKTAGIRVYGASEGRWSRTRATWNEHAYHVTNVGEDGSVPISESPHFAAAATNGFRMNRVTAAAPDLVVSVAPSCAAGYSLVARVRNVGSAFVAAGVVVGFYDGHPSGGGTRLGEASTTRRLEPLGSEDVALSLALSPGGPVFALADDGPVAGPWRQCTAENDLSAPVSPTCAAAP